MYTRDSRCIGRSKLRSYGRRVWNITLSHKVACLLCILLIQSRSKRHTRFNHKCERARARMNYGHRQELIFRTWSVPFRCVRNKNGQTLLNMLSAQLPKWKSLHWIGKIQHQSQSILWTRARAHLSIRQLVLELYEAEKHDRFVQINVCGEVNWKQFVRSIGSKINSIRYDCNFVRRVFTTYT